MGRLKGQRTLHPILATVSTPIARPVVAAVRLRRGKAADVRGAGPFIAEALAAAPTPPRLSAFAPELIRVP
ncbi:hypothetical protein [Kitasatospora sp. McL0602]|uniref:hypothetical protein n=1 Tax=Kitasatospora sp. McL0602 TaxID=3439530 RepID=UPI003F8B025D